MKVSELNDEEIKKAERDYFNDALDKIEYNSDEPDFNDGWNAAMQFAKLLEKGYCRCAKCNKPVLHPWEYSPKPQLIGQYGGDICGEMVFCKDCYEKMSDEERMQIIKKNFSV